MKYLIYSDPADAYGFSHEVRCRMWPNHQPVNNPLDVPYKFVVKLHPTDGRAACVVQDKDIGLLTEDEQLDLVDELSADWTPAEETP